MIYRTGVNSFDEDISNYQKSRLAQERLHRQLDSEEGKTDEIANRLGSYLEKFWFSRGIKPPRIPVGIPSKEKIEKLYSLKIYPANPLSDKSPYNTIDVSQYAALARNILEMVTGEPHSTVIFGQYNHCLKEDVLMFGVLPTSKKESLPDLNGLYFSDRDVIREYGLNGEFTFMCGSEDISYIEERQAQVLSARIVPAAKKKALRTAKFKNHVGMVTTANYLTNICENFKGRYSACNSEDLAGILLNILAYKHCHEIPNFTDEQYKLLLDSLFCEKPSIMSEAKESKPAELKLTR